METAFKNKVAIITGGSSGIGRAACISPKKGTKLLL
jgi:NADP-dependent 3-hydroxy acid dehydrogenase YdfG